MRFGIRWAACAGAAAFVGSELASLAGQSRPFQQRAIPVTWEDSALRTSQLPLANPGFSPVPVPADFYYRMPYGRFTRVILYTARVASRPVISIHCGGWRRA